jgi:phage-related protein
MIHLRDVRMVTAGALARIEPMKEQITLLRRHQVTMDPSKDQLVELEMIKAEMKEVSDYALSQVKAKILPIQKKESENIKEDVK